VLRLLLKAAECIPGGRGTRYSLDAMQGAHDLPYLSCGLTYN
jgi:hypothetical protein